MSGLQRFLNRMILFVIAVAILGAALARQLVAAFEANPFLNGTIFFVLMVGIVFAFRQVMMLKPEIEWVRMVRRGEGSLPERTPRLLGPLAAMLDARSEGREARMSSIAMRSLLDGVASRLEEGRDISRYLTRLLVFLGLLGTFWGLLAVLAAIGDTIEGLSVETSDITLMFDSLKRGLEEPLSGMAVAFSSSLFGLAGSVVLGFLDLQTGQAQNRFFNDLEDWLSSIARVSRGGVEIEAGDGSGPAAGAYLSALLEQMADRLGTLSDTLSSAETARAEERAALGAIADGLSALGDRMQADRQIAQRMATSLANTERLLERLGAEGMGAVAEPDEVARGHLRAIDDNIARLIEGQAKAAQGSIEALRSEIRLLARTLATALETAKVSETQKGGRA